MDPPPFLLWPGFRGSIRERVSLRDKGARARGVGEALGLCAGLGVPAATPRRPPAPGFHVCLSPRTARGSAGHGVHGQMLTASPERHCRPALWEGSE